MAEIIETFIKLKGKLNQSDYFDIDNLKNICYEYDKTQLKLELDYKITTKDKNCDDNKINLINEFMFYDKNILIGYAGIGDFGGDALEINGMVHPDYRRMGIFKKLFFLVKDEFLKRNSKEMLLLSDRKSSSGITFIKSICNEYDHSEYDMELNMNAVQELKFNNINLRKVSINLNDAKEIARQDSIYFNIEYDEENTFIKSDESSNTYFAVLDNTIIGKVRTEINYGIGGIYGLGVLPEHRGKGYGRGILTMAVNKLKNENANKIILQVDVDNINALNLYKSCGFEENHIMDYYKLRKINADTNLIIK